MNTLKPNGEYFSLHQVRWDDLDANGHMRNSAYLDLSVQVRFEYFAAGGFTTAEFARHGVGPVVLAEQLIYKRECFLMEELRIGFRVVELKDDGSRFSLVTDIFKADGELAAQVSAQAAVFHLAIRRIGPAPEKMLDLLRAAKAETP
jgi:acyl-CoA thioester hydrolase